MSYLYICDANETTSARYEQLISSTHKKAYSCRLYTLLAKKLVWEWLEWVLDWRWDRDNDIVYCDCKKMAIGERECLVVNVDVLARSGMEAACRLVSDSPLAPFLTPLTLHPTDKRCECTGSSAAYQPITSMEMQLLILARTQFKAGDAARKECAELKRLYEQGTADFVLTEALLKRTARMSGLDGGQFNFFGSYDICEGREVIPDLYNEFRTMLKDMLVGGLCDVAGGDVYGILFAIGKRRAAPIITLLNKTTDYYSSSTGDLLDDPVPLAIFNACARLHISRHLHGIVYKLSAIAALGYVHYERDRRLWITRNRINRGISNVAVYSYLLDAFKQEERRHPHPPIDSTAFYSHNQSNSWNG